MKYERVGIALAVLLLAAALVACGQQSVQGDTEGKATAEVPQAAGPSDAEIEQIEGDLNDIAATDTIDESELDGLDEDLAQI